MTSARLCARSAAGEAAGRGRGNPGLERMCLGPRTGTLPGRVWESLPASLLPPHLLPPLCHLLPAGKYIENHGVVHNMYYNTTSKVKLPYHATLGIQSWWDNGSIPIWITAQRQVGRAPSPRTAVGGQGTGGPGPERL